MGCFIESMRSSLHALRQTDKLVQNRLPDRLPPINPETKQAFFLGLIRSPLCLHSGAVGGAHDADAHAGAEQLSLARALLRVRQRPH